MPGHKKMRNGLTPQQTKFTKVVLKQIVEKGKINGTQAALETYDTKDPKTAGNIASINLKNPSIAKTIEEALNNTGLDLASIAEELKPLATAEVTKVSGDVKLRAITEILKLHGAYPGAKGKIGTTITKTVKEMTYSDAKKAFQTIHEQTTSFISEAD